MGRVKNDAAAVNETKTATLGLPAEEEKTVNAAQTQAEAVNRRHKAVKMIYIGPTLPNAMLKTNRVFDGTESEIKKELAPVFEKYPLAERLLVRTEGLAEKKDRIRRSGNILNKYYSDLASVIAAKAEKEG